MAKVFLDRGKSAARGASGRPVLPADATFWFAWALSRRTTALLSEGSLSSSERASQVQMTVIPAGTMMFPGHDALPRSRLEIDALRVIPEDEV
jgi:hypothetical protein